MNATIKNLLLWMVILVLIILAWNVFKTGATTVEEVNFSQFLDQVAQGHVQKVTIRGEEISGVYATSAAKHEPRFKTYAPTYPDLVKDLRAKGVEIEITPQKDSTFVSALVMYGPLILLVAIWFVIMRQMQAGGNKAMSFGKSRAKLLTPTQKKVTFKDVAGVEEAKVELQEIIEFLKDPQKFQKLGGKIPKGVLLIGSPGTGKTLLARAVAGEANVPFFTISGSDFVEMFVGVGASRVRDLFEQGKKNAPCIIFIDEIDAVGRHRGAGLGGGHDEREQTLNALLVEMDGFDTNEGVILVAATNRPDVLDPALLRPGRFDRRVVVDRPDLRGREQILKVHTRSTPLSENVDLSIIARGTPGFSGADLANLVNEAALNAARFNKKKLEMIDFEYAKDKVMMGPERKSMIMTEEEKKNTAYHEGGHALVAAILPGRRSRAQGHHHSARPRARPDDAAAVRGQVLAHQGVPGVDDHRDDGRTHRRGRVPRAHDHRRGQRHRARHGPRAQDGLRVGHERARPPDLRPPRAGDLPRARPRAHAGLLGGDRQPDRRRGQAHRDRRVRPGEEAHHRQPRRRCTASPGPCSRRKSSRATRSSRSSPRSPEPTSRSCASPGRPSPRSCRAPRPRSRTGRSGPWSPNRPREKRPNLRRVPPRNTRHEER